MKQLIAIIITILLSFKVWSQTDGRVISHTYLEPQDFITFKVDTKQFVTNTLELDKTYKINENTFEVIVGTNQQLGFLFSNGLSTYIRSNSEFRVNSFTHVTKEPKHPQKLSVERYDMNISLEGEGIFTVSQWNETDHLLLQTPVSNIGFHKGKFFVESSKKSTLIYVLEGSLDVFDNLNNKKKLVESSNVVLIQSTPSLSPRQQELFGDVITTSIKKLTSTTQSMEFLKVANKLESESNDTIFILINSDIVGVRLK
jgi:hypothetical protein